ncbi:MAG: lipoate--protein ligase [Anaerovoracaceae bacterium]
MKYIESHETDPYFNLALEEYVFEKLDRSDSYFILWQNFNTIVVGKFQNTIEEINKSFVDEHGIRVARRLSGGGAVYHDKGNLNYTFIVDKDDQFDFNFRYFIIPVISTLRKLGVKAEFNGRNDITIDGKKFSGNSQYIKQNRIMHHGCIMLDSNLEDVAGALQVKAAKFESKSTKSVRSRVTTINANAPKPISMEEFKTALKNQVIEENQLEEYVLTEEDLAEIRRLRDEKYSTWEWNYGASPAYSILREKKFDFGMVSVYLNVDKGKIENIKIYGDFFGNGAMEDLENAMIGIALDENLEKTLEKLPLSDFISGMKPELMAGLLVE